MHLFGLERIGNRRARHSLLTTAVIALAAVTLIGFASLMSTLLDKQIMISVHENAKDRTQAWIERLHSSMPSATELIKTGTAPAEDLRRLNDPLALGDILHFQFFGPNGEPTFVSTNSGFLNHDEEHDSDDNISLGQALRGGVPVTSVRHNHDQHASHPEKPHAIASTYFPVHGPQGDLIGVVETYLDVSQLFIALEDAFHLVGRYLVLGTLAVISLPIAAYGLKTRQVLRADRKLLELTRFDQLTGALNRNSLSEFLTSYFSSRNDPSGLGILFVDIDHFKHLNDSFGHHFGDQILHNISSALKASLRSDDVIGRYGGDEFVILCPGATITGLRRVYRRLASKIRASLEEEGIKEPISISVGAYISRPGDTERTALRAADVALYEAKRRGRNQTVEYSDSLLSLAD
jgi:diguanylate cyclase (GGDEF)-like protein